MQPPSVPLHLKPSPRAISLYYFGIFAALGVYLPYFPRWLDARGVQGFAMGVITATLPAMSLVAPPAFGVLADVLGVRIWLLRAACAGAFLVFALLTLAAALGVPLGAVGLFFAVLAFAFFRAPMFQMADVVALEMSTGAGISYGRLRLWGSLSFALTATAAGFWLDVARPAMLPATIAAALLIAFAISWALPARGEVLFRRRDGGGDPGAAEAAPRARSARSVRAQARALLQRRDFRLFLGAAFLAQAAGSSYDLCYSLHLRDAGLSERLVGVAWAVGVFAEIALMASSGRLLAWAPAPVLLAISYLGASLRWALLSWVSWGPALVALQPLHAVSFALLWIASLAYTKERAPPEILATAQGLFSASAGAGSVLGMPVWGELYKRGGGALTFGVASIAAFLAFVLAVPFARSARRAPEGG